MYFFFYFVFRINNSFDIESWHCDHVKLLTFELHKINADFLNTEVTCTAVLDVMLVCNAFDFVTGKNKSGPL